MEAEIIDIAQICRELFLIIDITNITWSGGWIADRQHNNKCINSPRQRMSADFGPDFTTTVYSAKQVLCLKNHLVL